MSKLSNILRIGHILVLCMLTLWLPGQELQDKEQRFQFSLSVRGGMSSHFAYPYDIIQCIEGCTAIKQNPKIGFGVAGILSYHLDPGNQLLISLEYSQHRFTDFSSDNLFGNSTVYFPTPIKLEFYSIGIGHEWLKGSKFLENQLILDAHTGSQRGINSPNLSYQVYAGIRKVNPSTSTVQIGPYFKTALTNYFTSYFPMSKSKYFPFSLGLRAQLNFVGRK